MSSTEYAVKMDYNQMWPSIFTDFGFHHPEASFVFWFITDDREPLNKSTWIRNTLMHERKKKENTSNIQPTHPWQFWTCIDKNTIISSMTLSPSWSRANVFTPHAAASTGVTGSSKGGRCTKKKGKFPPKHWACVD